MKHARLIILIFLFLVIGCALAALFYYQFYLIEYHEVDMDFKVRIGEAGINTDTDALHFGHIPPGGMASRRMSIIPVRDSRLVIRFSGFAAPMISMEENVFQAITDELLNITFYVSVPPETPSESYNGTAHFYFYRW